MPWTSQTLPPTFNSVHAKGRRRAIAERLNSMIADGMDDAEAIRTVAAMVKRGELSGEFASDFPTKGDDLKPSLRNSQWRQFDHSFAERIRTEHPDVWRAGGNERGNGAYQNWTRVRDGEDTEALRDWLREREAWAARHRENKRLAGVVALMKWGVVGDIGEDRMKQVINEAARKSEMAAIYTGDTLPPTFDDFDPPLSALERDAAASRLTAQCAALEGEGFDEAEALNLAIDRVVAGLRRERGDVEEAPPSERPPVPSVAAMEDYSLKAAGGHGEVVELLAPLGYNAGSVHIIRGVKRVLGPRNQVLVLEGTEYQGARRIDVTREMLEEMAQNAPHWPLIPIDFDHQSGKGRGGVSGGIVIAETLHVQRDPATKRWALMGQLAFNEDVAGEVRRGEWLGGSIRIGYPTNKKTGEELGFAITAWSLTNVPQQHEIEIAASFNNGLDSDTGNRLAGTQLHKNGAATTTEETMDIKPITEALELSADASAEDIAAKVAELSAAAATAAESAAAEKERADKAEAKVTELSADKTGLASQVAELSAKAEKTAADFAEFKAGAEAKSAEAEVDLLIEKRKVQPAERELAVALRKQGGAVWEQFAALHTVEVRQAEVKGSAQNAPETAELSAESAGIEFRNLCNEYAEKHKVAVSTARKEVSKTERGKALREAIGV